MKNMSYELYLPRFASRPFLMKSTLSCRLCSRAVGDLVGRPGRPVSEARFVPTLAGILPDMRTGTPRCARCGGRLYLDDIEPLASGVTLEEVGGPSYGQMLLLMRSGRTALVTSPAHADSRAA